jgi:hypothetical protein
MSEEKQAAALAVPEKATQRTETRDRDRWWMEASIWTERMVSALDNGVKGGKWFSLVDNGFIRRRLRALLRKQAKRPGFGRCLNNHQRWPIAFFAAHGLFTLSAAYQQARHPR